MPVEKKQEANSSRTSGPNDFSSAPFTTDASDPDQKYPINHTNDSFYRDRMTATRKGTTMQRKRLTAETLTSRSNNRIAHKAYRLTLNLFGRTASAATYQELAEIGRALRTHLGDRRVAQLHDRIARIASEVGEEPFPMEVEAEEDFPLDGKQPVDFANTSAIVTVQESEPSRAVIRTITKEGQDIKNPTASKRAAAEPAEEMSTEVKDPEEVEQEDDDHVDEETDEGDDLGAEGDEDLSAEGDDEIGDGEDEDLDDEDDDFEDDEDYDDEDDDYDIEDDDYDDEDFDDEDDEDDEDFDDEDDEDEDFDDEGSVEGDEGLDGVLTDKPTASKRRARQETPRRPSRWRYERTAGAQRDEWDGFLSESIPDLPSEYTPQGAM